MDQDRSAGRQPIVIHTEPWAPIAVVLLDRHVAYLDRLAYDIRMKLERGISRDEVISALIEWALKNADRASLDKYLVQFAGASGKSESP